MKAIFHAALAAIISGVVVGALLRKQINIDVRR
jgi:hypothetical protein